MDVKHVKAKRDLPVVVWEGKQAWIRRITQHVALFRGAVSSRQVDQSFYNVPEESAALIGIF